MRIQTIIFTTLFVFVSFLQGADNKNPISMFPEAKSGFVQYVITLPRKVNESNYKVELIVGKKILADCNKHFFLGKINTKTVHGWGYNYIEFDNINISASTRMACIKPKQEKFISIKDKLRRYNSRLPMVAYIPKGYEMHYRIWQADKKIETAFAK